MWLTRVESGSMAPGLPDGRLVWTVALPRRCRLRRGAVVAVDSRELDRRVVKRVVGLPGEHLHLEGGRTLVDGRLLVEPYATAWTGTCPFDVPDGHYLLLGDDRAVSSDARRWRDPYVERGEIVGLLVTRQRRSSAGVSERGLGSVPAMSRSRRWRDLSGGQRILLVVAVTVELVLTTWALSDLAARPPRRVRGPRWAWALGCLVQPVGPPAYLVLGRRR